MDTGLIPFYVFIAIMAQSKYVQSPGTDLRWTSLFATDDATTTLLLATNLVATSLTALHVVSDCLDLYLVLVFRKIANLPPDMNPLEDNLTSRRKSKHKQKNSSVSAIMSEKRISNMTESTVSPSRASHISQGDSSVSNSQAVPFFHTRTDSDPSFSPHNPRTVARLSETNLPQQAYQQPYSARGSRAELLQHDSFLNPAVAPISRPQSTRGSLNGSPAGVNSLPFPQLDNENYYRRSAPDLKSDNWFVSTRSSEDDEDTTSASRDTNRERTYAALFATRDHGSTTQQPLGMNPPTPPILQGEPPLYAYNHSDDKENQSKLKGNWEVLENPTSNSERSSSYHDGHRNSSVSSLDTVLTTITHNRNGATTPSVVSDLSTAAADSNPWQPQQQRMHKFSKSIGTGSLVRAGTPKSRFYGDLGSATRGVRKDQHDAPSPSASPMQYQAGPERHSYPNPPFANASPQRPSQPHSPGSWKRGPNPFSNRSSERVDSIGRTTDRRDWAAGEGSPTRVVSRSGVDDALMDDVDYGHGHDSRRREVSGKVAEEGRGGPGGRGGGGYGGWFGGGLVQRKVSGIS